MLVVLICLQRRGGDSNASQESDRTVNQLLTLIDGFEETSNIFVVGTTNRLDLLDPALLRSGRLEIQLSVGLPNEESRYQILKVHTKELVAKNMLKVDEDFLRETAKRTVEWSGADIASFVQLALSNALNLHSISSQTDTVELTTDHFTSAINAIYPKIETRLADELQNKDFIRFPRFDKVFKFMEYFLSANLTSDVQTCLLIGPGGSGKSSVAHQVAKIWYQDGRAVERISSDDMVGVSEFVVCQIIQKVFTNARKFQKSIVIVDGIEGLLHINSMTNGYSTIIANALMKELKGKTHEGRILFVLGTIHSKMWKISEVSEAFAYRMELPLVRISDGVEILKNEGFFTGERSRMVDQNCLLFEKQITIKVLLTLLTFARSKGRNVSAEDLLQAIELTHMQQMN